MRNVPSLFVALLLLSAAPVAAQIVRVPAPGGRSGETRQTTGPRPLHVTDRLLALPESRAALDDFQRRREAGLLPAAHKSTATPGDTKDYRVYSFVSQQRETINFTLVSVETRFDIWVETTEYQNRVDDALVESLRAALADHTPSGSIDANSGIIVNDEVIFGSPPDADGDGKTDVLVLDIRDSCATTNQCVLGFFFPPDLGGTTGRDIIYLDIDPGITLFGEDEVLQTAAHEYQHLIHAAYDPDEETFVNEGLSEYAEVMNGYRARPISYLSDLFQQRRTLVNWPSSDLGSDDDYQRAGLFTNYLAERTSPQTVGLITQDRFYGGVAGYQDVLSNAGFELKNLVRDFHVANFVNDRAAGEAYGYATPQYSTVAAAARTEHDGNESDGIPTQTFGALPPGAVDYHVITNVADLTVALITPDGSGDPAVIKARLAPMIAITWDDGRKEVFDTPIRDQPYDFTGNVREAVIVVAHAQVSGSTVSLSYDLSASWSPAAPEFRQEEVTYDDGKLAGLEVVGLPPEDLAANRFPVPDGATLVSVSVAPLFDHDLQGSEIPPSAPRDYRLSIFGESVDPRIPAAEPFFTIDRVDARGGSLTSDGTDYFFVFDQINLGAYQAELSNLPDNLFITLENLGDDENYLAYPISVYDSTTVESPSLFYSESIFNPPGWRRFAQLTLNSRSLGDRVLPVRATFSIPVAAESAADLPTAYELEPNWPNPFNPSTTIAWRAPVAGRVRLDVFDVLGRRVATLVDRVTTAGRHETRFDATGLASGIYLYVLEAGGERLARPMILLK